MYSIRRDNYAALAERALCQGTGRTLEEMVTEAWAGTSPDVAARKLGVSVYHATKWKQMMDGVWNERKGSKAADFQSALRSE